MKSSLAQLQQWVPDATLTADAVVEGVSTDSREAVGGTLFVALRGERFDAHAFVSEAVARGAAAVVIEHPLDGLTVPALIVPDTRAALAHLARHWRAQFGLPVIGVTGSNGKTTVKEMIASVLAAAYGPQQCLATRGNLNNDIGVPLTVLRMDERHRAAVVELGMNHPGEIGLLAGIAQPTVALVNNAQREHQEFMASVEAVAMENGSVITALAADGTAVFPADDPYTPLWRAYAGQRNVLSFGFGADADVTCTYQPNASGSELQVVASGWRFEVTLAAAGVHNVRNALAAIACALAAGIDIDAIRRGLASFAPVSGRLQHNTAPSGARVIDDTYNANPDSVRAAIDVLAQCGAPRMLVLGDMGEVGDQGPQFHAEVGAYAKACGIERLYAFGELARHSALAFGGGAVHFSDIDGVKQAVAADVTANTTVLVKGSRFMRMERVVQHLIGQQERGAH
jgi:UDP-N-acetylmuramoyl-tripeptide--D-alanyl-D-alanine ligase